jgi:hypothetical protein
MQRIKTVPPVGAFGCELGSFRAGADGIFEVPALVVEAMRKHGLRPEDVPPAIEAPPSTSTGAAPAGTEAPPSTSTGAAPAGTEAAPDQQAAPSSTSTAEASAADDIADGAAAATAAATADAPGVTRRKKGAA